MQVLTAKQEALAQVSQSLAEAQQIDAEMAAELEQARLDVQAKQVRTATSRCKHTVPAHSDNWHYWAHSVQRQHELLSCYPFPCSSYTH